MVFKSIDELGPASAYVTGLLDNYTPRSGIRSCSIDPGIGLLEERFAKTQWVTRSFMIAAAKLWNSLPYYSLQSSNNLLTKSKTYLFNEAFA